MPGHYGKKKTGMKKPVKPKKAMTVRIDQFKASKKKKGKR